jgi:hypothetical protein
MAGISSVTARDAVAAAPPFSRSPVTGRVESIRVSPGPLSGPLMRLLSSAVHPVGAGVRQGRSNARTLTT